MTQIIYVSGLRGSVTVTMQAWLVGSEKLTTDFPSSYNATFQLADAKRTTRLEIMATMSFPSYKEGDGWITGYFHNVKGTFENIVQADGRLVFPDTQISLQGAPTMNPYSLWNKFRYIEGTAWLTTSNNPRIPVIKIKLIVGSQDAYSDSKSTSETDPSSKETTEWEVGGEYKVSVKRTTKEENTGKTVSRGGTSTTAYGPLWQQALWTLSLRLPEPKPAPGPWGLPDPYTIYFDTGKSDADHYRSPLSGMGDQIKGLQEYINVIDKTYKIENIESATVTGHASGLGDTRGNIKLSGERAKYVANLLSTLKVVNIPENKIIPKGAPTNSDNKDNRPEERRAELLIRMQGSAPRVLPSPGP